MPMLRDGVLEGPAQEELQGHAVDPLVVLLPELGLGIVPSLNQPVSNGEIRGPVEGPLVHVESGDGQGELQVVADAPLEFLGGEGEVLRHDLVDLVFSFVGSSSGEVGSDFSPRLDSVDLDSLLRSQVLIQLGNGGLTQTNPDSHKAQRQ